MEVAAEEEVVKLKEKTKEQEMEEAKEDKDSIIHNFFLKCLIHFKQTFPYVRHISVVDGR